MLFQAFLVLNMDQFEKDEESEVQYLEKRAEV